MTNKPLQAIGLALLFTLGSAELLAAKSGYYRWTDDEGEVHFTQKPPLGRPSVFVETASGRQSSPSVRNNTASSSPSDDGTDTPSAGTPNKMEVLPPKDPKLCTQAQGNMESLSVSGARIKATDKDGKARYLTPEEIEVQKQRAQDIIDIHC